MHEGSFEITRTVPLSLKVCKKLGKTNNIKLKEKKEKKEKQFFFKLFKVYYFCTKFILALSLLKVKN